MSRFYLNVPFKEKDQAKRLGARFDWDEKRWYVSSGTDLVPFSAWLPNQDSASVSPPPQPGFSLLDEQSPAQGVPQGIPLSQLMRTIAHTVGQVYGPEGVWTLVEVVDIKARGHLYLEVSERDDQGLPIATARAILWQSAVTRIVPEFERITGTSIQAGIKLLVRARPELHPQYGFSLHIDAIDASYTLGELEARRREIRTRLQREGIFERNRQLPAPWDYRLILVVAPEQGAGLGDFRKEAARLEHFGLCRFVYAFSRFQGEGAAKSIADTLTAALQSMQERPDAVTIIRGGGAVGDLAWLDDFELVRTICVLPIPVLTGIGHERDNVLLDEVAHARYDTPSKVIAAIEQLIRWRAQQAMNALSTIIQGAHGQLQQSSSRTEQHMARIREGAQYHIALARSHCTQASLRIQHDAEHTVQAARLLARQHIQTLQDGVRRQVMLARQRVPSLLQDSLVYSRARLRLAQSRSLGLLREILGQGPDKALTRGFAIVRSAGGSPIMRKSDAQQQGHLNIQFKDGALPVKPL